MAVSLAHICRMCSLLFPPGRVINTIPKGKTHAGGNTMNTTYTFKKNGKSYSAKGSNRFDAQLSIELAYHIDLTGATFEEVYKLRVVRTGTVR